MNEEEVVKIISLSIEPNQCPLAAPISIHLRYTLLRPLKKATWDVLYEADYTNKRIALNLSAMSGHRTGLDSGTGPNLSDVHCSSSSSVKSGTRQGEEDLEIGDHDFSFVRDHLPVEGVKEKYLLQVGVLKLILRAEEGNVTSVNMVSQVIKGKDGTLMRNVISPVE